MPAPNMKPSEMEAIISQAGLHITEVAWLFQVARSTVYDWFNGVPPRNRFLYDNACAITRKIKRATDRGLLPPKQQGKKAREQEILVALKDGAR